MKKVFLSFLAAAVLLLVSAVPASAQNGVFAPYVSVGVSTNAISTFSSPSFNAALGIESSSKYVLLDINGNFQSSSPIAAIKACYENNVTSPLCTGYSSGIQGSAYVKVYGAFLVGGGAEWNVNPATVQTSIRGDCANIKTCIAGITSNANPFVGGGFQVKHDRFLVNYVLPGADSISGEHSFNAHNEIFLAHKTHLRITQDVSFVTGTVIASPSDSTHVTGYSVGVGLKLVL
jgi:hypothetical protein